MYSFGKSLPRSLKSFGVSGLLGEECRVFYSPLFSSAHLGRVSDLLLARLREFQTDEFSLRAVLLSTFFEAYHFHQKQNPGELLPKPLILECGVDSEKIAVGVSFVLSPGVTIDFSNLSEKIKSGKDAGVFENFLVSLLKQAQRVVLRHESKSRQLEVVSLIGMPSKMEDSWLEGPHLLEVLEMDAGAIPGDARAMEYVELGDLDYATLLRDDVPGKNIAPSPTGEILVQAFTQGLEKETDEFLKGHPESNTEGQKISDTTSGTYEDRVRISGVTQNITDPTFLVQAGSTEEGEVERVIQGTSFWGKIWPFNKKTQKEEPEEEPEEILRDEPETTSAPHRATEDSGLVLNYRKDKKRGGLDGTGKTEEPPSPVTELGNPVVDISGLDQTFKKVAKEAVEIKKEITSSSAKRWVDGLIGELTAEKARLSEAAKKMNTVVRQKEFEYNNKERSLKEVIKEHEETIRQKNHTVTRLKEQISQLNLSVEKIKNTPKRPGEDVHLKQKYITIQKMLVATKEENVQLSSKVEELRNQLKSTQYTTKVRGPSYSDFAAVQGRLERAQRQLEDLKKTNLQMTQRVNISKREREMSVGNMEDLKKRLEEMSKVAAAAREVERNLRLQVEEFLRGEVRMRKEIEKVTVENKKLKEAISQSGGGGGKAA